VAGLEEFTTKTKRPEVPGEYCFPPLAALITAGARLLLAMLETEVTKRGGSYAFCDTDSMAIIATRHGGLIPCQGGPGIDQRGRACVRALTYAQVEEIIACFERLNPYDRRIIPGSILEVDDASLDDSEEIRELWAWAIAAKRYATFTWVDGRPVLAEKYSEHGLGHLADPRPRDQRDRPLAADIWQHILDAELAEAPDEPDWFDRPAVTQRSISNPHMLDLLDGDGHELRPYGFCNHVILHPDEPRAGSRERFDLVAPYERDPARWAVVEWADAETGERYQISTSSLGGGEVVRVKSIRDVVTLYRRKREAKSLGADGYPCARGTAGLLSRRSVRGLTIRHIGKEANEIEDLAAGIASAIDVTTAYAHPFREVYSQLILPALLGFKEAVVAQVAAIPRRTINGLRSGRRPDRETLRQLVPALAKLCSETAPATEDRGHLAALAAWRDREPVLRICPACGSTPPAGRIYCRPACRQAGYRRRLTRRLDR
jgi:hypothetical protein